MSRPVIEVRGVSLRRRTQEEFHYDLKRLIFQIIERRYRTPKRRTVLDDVSLTVAPGEKVGIIGPNGSGKSTLLKVVAGILHPTRGNVTVRGRIAPLIELGAGFDGDLSLVDNIIYYGILLGFHRADIERRIDAILDFAELQDHRNEPVKALSSGMVARLGFAIATDVRPEVLILDEVLSVGDESFRRKCADRIQRFWDEHSTIIVVSHDLGFIGDSCTRCLWLEEGRVRYDGDAVGGTRAYLDEVRRQWIARESETLLQRFNGQGGLVQAADAEGRERVYYVRDGRRHWVREWSWIAGNGMRGDHIESLDPAVVEAIPAGEDLV